MMLKITRRLFYDVGANDLPGVIDAGKGSYNGTGSVYQRKAISIISLIPAAPHPKRSSWKEGKSPSMATKLYSVACDTDVALNRKPLSKMTSKILVCIVFNSAKATGRIRIANAEALVRMIASLKLKTLECGSQTS